MKFCRKCGTQLNDGAMFCPKCGTKVQQEQSEQPQAQPEPQAQPLAQEQPKVQPQPQPISQEAPAPKKKGKGLLIAGICLAVLAIAAVAVLVLTKGDKSSDNKETEAAVVSEETTEAKEIEEIKETAEADEKKAEEEADADQPAEVAKVIITDEVSVDGEMSGYTLSYQGIDADGNMVWEYKTDINIYADLDSTEIIGENGGKVYVTDNGYLIALDRATGAVLWKNELPMGSCSHDFDDDGNLYVCGFYSGEMYKVSPEGKILFTAHFGDRYWPYIVSVDKDTVRVVFDGEPINGETNNEATFDKETGESLTENEIVNTHHYDFIIEDGTFLDAMNKAKMMGGYLANIETYDEFADITNQIEEKGLKNKQFKVGAARPSDSYNYYWLDADGYFMTGTESLNSGYSWVGPFWMDNEPSFQDGDIVEDCVDFFYYEKENRWVFNDIPNDVLSIVPSYSGKIGYIVEYDY